MVVKWALLNQTKMADDAVRIAFVDESTFAVENRQKNRNNRAKKNGWTFLQVRSSFSSSSETSEDDSYCNETDTALQASSIEDGSSSAEDSGGDSVEDSDEYDVEEQPENKSTRKRNTASRKKSGLAKDTGASRRKTDKDSEDNGDGFEELCFYLGENTLQLHKYAEDKLKNAKDINYFPSRASMRDHIIANGRVPLLAEEISEIFINNAREIFETTKPSAEKKSLVSHTWLTSCLPAFTTNTTWTETISTLASQDYDRGDQLSLTACLFEAVFDFAHIESRRLRMKEVEMLSGKVEDQTKEDDVILHRFGGASLYRMMKVRANTIAGKKGTVKVTSKRKTNLEMELSLLKQMKRESEHGLPRELTAHLNEGGLCFMKDGMLDFVRLADMETRKYTLPRVFNRSPGTFLKIVFDNVYNNEEVSQQFRLSLKSIGASHFGEDIASAVYKELLTKVCRTRLKVFMQGMKEKELESEKKVCDVDSSLRDKLKGYVQSSKR